MSEQIPTRKSRIFTGFWTVTDTKKYPNALFVFGDNYTQYGKKGQAVIRDQPNSFGISTQHKTGTSPSAYFNDNEYDVNVEKFNIRINQLIAESAKYDYVVWPANGLGTGLAKLPEKAPKTYAYFLAVITQLQQSL